jgi:hypothetical protein
MKGVSLAKLHSLTSDEDQPTADTRPAEIDKLLHVSGDLMDTINEVFAGTDVLADQAAVTAILETRREVETAWGRAKTAFIEVGRSLNRLDVRLPTREGRAALKAGFERLFPLSEPVASQFRRVAEMIDSGRVPVEACPGSYSAAYQLALLEPRELEAARSKGLVSANTSRSALIAFRKERSISVPQVDISGLLAEQRRLRATRRRLLEELLRTRKRFAEIARLLQETP